MIDADEIVIERLCNGLMDRDDIWWSRLICPGSWERVLGADASDFVSQWIEADRGMQRPPFAVLYPPLGLRRLKFEFAQITLWQVAVDLRFNVGVVDLIERPGLRHSSALRRVRPEFLASLKASGDRLESDSRNLEEAEHTEDVRTDDAPVSSPDDEPVNLTLENLLELLKADLLDLKKDDGISPKVVKRKLTKGDFVLDRAEDAARWTAFLLSLSHRRGNRLCVIDPEEPLTVLPNGPHELPFDLLALPSKPPEAVQIDEGWRAQCDVWLGAAIWRVSATVSNDGDVRVDWTERLAEAPENPPETQVGPVRLFDYAGEKYSA